MIPPHPAFYDPMCGDCRRRSKRIAAWATLLFLLVLASVAMGDQLVVARYVTLCDIDELIAASREWLIRIDPSARRPYERDAYSTAYRRWKAAVEACS